MLANLGWMVVLSATGSERTCKGWQSKAWNSAGHPFRFLLSHLWPVPILIDGRRLLRRYTRSDIFIPRQVPRCHQWCHDATTRHQEHVLSILRHEMSTLVWNTMAPGPPWLVMFFIAKKTNYFNSVTGLWTAKKVGYMFKKKSVL